MPSRGIILFLVSLVPVCMRVWVDQKIRAAGRKLLIRGLPVLAAARRLPGVFRRRRALAQFAEQLTQVPRGGGVLPVAAADDLSQQLRRWVRTQAGLTPEAHGQETIDDLLLEIEFLRSQKQRLRPLFQRMVGKRVLYAGQAYYNAWYLSRALRPLGWRADVLNWNTEPTAQIYYHGEDVRFTGEEPYELCRDLRFYVAALYAYDIFHFSNAHGLCFGFPLQSLMRQHFGMRAEIYLLKALGKIVVYTNNGCLDGVAQTSFAKWGPESACASCRWRDQPTVCSDARNLEWGAFRNQVADYQCLLGGNRVDYNRAPTVHEVPEFYCLDPDIWHPDLTIPAPHKLPAQPAGTVWLYHAVGNKVERTSDDGVNIKSSHIYLPLVEKLKREQIPVAMLEPTGIPNLEVRFLQAQADIFLDMLTFGWFGANIREAMMLGKPVICYIRPEWLESVRLELPEYADTLPIVSATPATVEAVLRDLIADPEKRRAIGRRSREFALKWHSAAAGGQRFDAIYTKLLIGDSLRLAHYA